jgi:hypothetical protein
MLEVTDFWKLTLPVSSSYGVNLLAPSSILVRLTILPSSKIEDGFY